MVWGTLLSNHGIDRGGVLIEVGPGFQDKIGLGLVQCQFHGTLYVVEPNAPARRWVTDRYRQLLPAAQIVPISDPIPIATSQLPQHVEALLMNHVLDDCLLFAALPPVDRDHVFSEMRAEHPGHLDVPRRWRNLLTHEADLGTAAVRVVDEFAELVERTMPRILGASQYASWFQVEHGLTRVDRIGAEMLAGLALRTGVTSEADCATLRQFGHLPDRWLVCARTPSGAEAT